MTMNVGRAATVELVRDDEVVALGVVAPAAVADLGEVERLLRLQLAVGAFGWTVRLSDVDHDLARLIRFVGSVPPLDLRP